MTQRFERPRVFDIVWAALPYSGSPFAHKIRPAPVLATIENHPACAWPVVIVPLFSSTKRDEPHIDVTPLVQWDSSSGWAKRQWNRKSFLHTSVTALPLNEQFFPGYNPDRGIEVIGQLAIPKGEERNPLYADAMDRVIALKTSCYPAIDWSAAQTILSEAPQSFYDDSGGINMPYPIRPENYWDDDMKGGNNGGSTPSP